jgi:hypothetical protein
MWRLAQFETDHNIHTDPPIAGSLIAVKHIVVILTELHAAIVNEARIKILLIRPTLQPLVVLLELILHLRPGDLKVR